MTLIPIIIGVPLTLLLLQFIGVFSFGNYPGPEMGDFWVSVFVVSLAIIALAVKERISRMEAAYSILFVAGAVCFFVVSLYLDTAKMRLLAIFAAGVLLAVCTGAFWSVCSLAVSRLRRLNILLTSGQSPLTSSDEVASFALRTYKTATTVQIEAPVIKAPAYSNKSTSAVAIATTAAAGYAAASTMRRTRDNYTSSASHDRWEDADLEENTPMVNIDGTPMIQGSYVDVHGQVYGHPMGAYGGGWTGGGSGGEWE